MGALVELYVLVVVLSASYSLESRNASRTISAQPTPMMAGAAPMIAAAPVMPAPQAIACDLLSMIVMQWCSARSYTPGGMLPSCGHATTGDS